MTNVAFAFAEDALSTVQCPKGWRTHLTGAYALLEDTHVGWIGGGQSKPTESVW
jgi:hypothetical protein